MRGDGAGHVAVGPPDVAVDGVASAPAEAGDARVRWGMPLGLAGHGAVLSKDAHQQDSQREVHREAQWRREEVARYTQSIPRVPAGTLVCEACRRPLDLLLAKARRHILC